MAHLGFIRALQWMRDSRDGDEYLLLCVCTSKGNRSAIHQMLDDILPVPIIGLDLVYRMFLAGAKYFWQVQGKSTYDRLEAAQDNMDDVIDQNYDEGHPFYDEAKVSITTERREWYRIQKIIRHFAGAGSKISIPDLWTAYNKDGLIDDAHPRAFRQAFNDYYPHMEDRDQIDKYFTKALNCVPFHPIYTGDDSRLTNALRIYHHFGHNTTPIDVNTFDELAKLQKVAIPEDVMVAISDECCKVQPYFDRLSHAHIKHVLCTLGYTKYNNHTVEIWCGVTGTPMPVADVVPHSNYSQLVKVPLRLGILQLPFFQVQEFFDANTSLAAASYSNGKYIWDEPKLSENPDNFNPVSKKWIRAMKKHIPSLKQVAVRQHRPKRKLTEHAMQVRNDPVLNKFEPNEHNLSWRDLDKYKGAYVATTHPYKVLKQAKGKYRRVFPGTVAAVQPGWNDVPTRM